MDRVFHKQKAKALISKNLSAAVLVTCIPLGILFISVIAELAGFSTVSPALTIVQYLLMPVTATLTIAFIKGEDFVVKDKMNEDTNKNVGRYMGTMALTYLYTFLWSLLFLIPGIIKGYSYYLVPYILSDNPELSYNQAIDESRRLMDGRKMEMFIYDFSFFFWILLSGLTLGIAGIYVIPYMQLTTSSIFLDIKEQDLRKRGLFTEPEPEPSPLPSEDTSVMFEEVEPVGTDYTLDEDVAVLEEVEIIDDVILDEEDIDEDAKDGIADDEGWKTVEPVQKVSMPDKIQPVEVPKEVSDTPTSIDDLKK